MEKSKLIKNEITIACLTTIGSIAIASCQGEKGAMGSDGAQGPEGSQGPQGPQGPSGELTPPPVFSAVADCNVLTPRITVTPTSHTTACWGVGAYHAPIHTDLLYTCVFPYTLISGPTSILATGQALPCTGGCAPTLVDISCINDDGNITTSTFSP